MLLDTEMAPPLNNATYGSVQLTVPKGFSKLLEKIAHEVVKSQPSDIVKFTSDLLAKLLEARTNPEVDPHHAASTIQRHYRGFKDRKEFVKKREAARAIEKKYHQHHLKRNESATKIQATYRGYKVRKCKSDVHLKDLRKKSAVKIQSVYRGHRVRKSKSTFQIEEMQNRADELGLETSAIKIQAVYRGYRTRKNIKKIDKPLLDEEASAIKIQAVYRGYSTRKSLKETKQPDQKEIKDFLDDIEKAAIIIQKNYKGYITRKKMQDHV